LFQGLLLRLYIFPFLFASSPSYFSFYFSSLHTYHSLFLFYPLISSFSYLFLLPLLLLLFNLIVLLNHYIFIISFCSYFLSSYFFHFISSPSFVSGVRLSPLCTAATTGLLYQPQMIDDGNCGETGGIKIGRGNRSTRRKPAPAPLCPPQIPHDQTRAPTQAAAVGSQRLTT
jgi:hypothetical protein